ncbi:hypothetical protein [Taklimakanibacter lacteus]|uniref:hypothetical protein n=1 Tax=Taklimakanibacter lacteus TaxID=2268456 RepID=UPI000E666307
MKRYRHFLAVLLILIVTSGHSMASSLEAANELWHAGKPFEAAKEVYPLAIRSNAIAQLRFAFYVLIATKMKSFPEQADWETKSHDWLLELAQSQKNPEIAAATAEVLSSAVGSGGLKFAKSEKIAQCWFAVKSCWEDVMVSQKGSARCVALARQALVCE